MKVFRIIALSLAAILWKAEARSTSFGAVTSTSIILDKDSVFEGPCDSEAGCSVKIKFPKDGDFNERLIQYIVCRDEVSVGNAKGKVVSGGIGHKNVEIEISYGKGEMLNFSYQIYGNQLAS